MGLRRNPGGRLVSSVPSRDARFSPPRVALRVCRVPLEMVNRAATRCSQVRGGVFCRLCVGSGVSGSFGLRRLRVAKKGRLIVSITRVVPPPSVSSSFSSCTGPSGVMDGGVAIVEDVVVRFF